MQIAISPAVAPPLPVFLPLATPTPPLQAVVLPASPAPPLLTSEISDSPDVDQDMGEAPTSPAPPSCRTSPEPQTPPPPTSSPATSPVPSPSTTVPATESFVSSLQGSLPKFITPEVVEHFNGITNVPGWSDLIQNYLKFEAASPSKGVSDSENCLIGPDCLPRQTSRLPLKGCPPLVDVWMNNAKELKQTVHDTVAFAERWREWWIKCQPSERTQEQWPFPREPRPGLDWGKLLNGGRRGIFLFVISLSWWATSLDSSISLPELIEAIDDLNWVLCQLATGLLPRPSLAPPSTHTDVANTSLPKRKIKLTEKAADAGESVRKRFCRA